MMTAKSFLALILFVALKRVSSTLIDDDKCMKQFVTFYKAINDNEVWALRLYGLWGKIEPGFYAGNIFSFGQFSECLNFTDTVEEDNDVVEGQYCMVSLRPLTTDKQDGAKLWKGVCVPASCSPEKIVMFLGLFQLENGYEVVTIKCQTREPLPLDIVDIATISLLTIFGILLLTSTAYDKIIRRSKDREPHKLLIAFSVYTNGKRLFHVFRNKSSKTIDCIEGMRCMSLLGIIFFHRNLLQQARPATNLLEVYQRRKQYENVLFQWPTFFVDTFFVIGGFLSSLHFLHAFEARKFSLFKTIIHRYVRYTPVLAAAILIYASLSQHIKSPWPDVISVEDCSGHWWSALLHIQNYVNPESICPLHTWYLSVDFQLFVISPLLIYPARRYGWKYLWILPTLAVASSIFVILTALSNKYEPSALASSGAVGFNENVYVPTHTRLGPWLIGMVLAYIIFESRAREIKLHKTLVKLLHTLALALLAVNVALLYPASQMENNPLTLMQSSIRLGFMRLCWSLPVAWIIFACYKLQTGGIVRWFLSLPEWQPIGRLSLSMYVTHLQYQRLLFLQEKTPPTLDVMPLCLQFLGDILAALIIATFFWLTFETPFILIENYFHKRPQQKTYELSSEKIIGENSKKILNIAS